MALKPGVTRQGGRVTGDWGEIGFQGKDPATDFRYDVCVVEMDEVGWM